MWETLLAILLGEVVLGVPGIILAPTLLHYAKEELRALPSGRDVRST
jgi:predicted PurR-regulated permease PerM